MKKILDAASKAREELKALRVKFAKDAVDIMKCHFGIKQPSITLEVPIKEALKFQINDGNLWAVDIYFNCVEVKPI